MAAPCSLCSGGSGGAKPKTTPNYLIIDFVTDQRFIESVIGSHWYDQSTEEKCNVDGLRDVVNNIISGVLLAVDKDESGKKNVTDTPLPTMPSDISHLIDWIYCQMTCEDTQGQNVEDRLRGIFDKLRVYRWTTQILLVLAAFALQYGEFWYASEAPIEGQTAVSIYLFRGLNSLKKKIISDGNKKAALGTLKMVVEYLRQLASDLLDLAKRVIEYPGMTELATTFQQIPGWSCATIIAIVATANIFAQVVGIHKLAESERAILARVSLIKSAVDIELQRVETVIGHTEEYQRYMAKVKAPVDIAYFLRSLLAKDSSPDSVITDPKNCLPIEYDFFRKKNVLLIISDKTISEYDAATLKRIHEDRKHIGISKEEDPGAIQILTKGKRPYELVWIPIVDADHENLEALPSESVRRWAYTVYPLKINSFASRYIKEEWRFKRETMVVVLNPIGRVENTDAMPMLRILKTDAYPFTLTETAHRWKVQYDRWFGFVLREVGVPSQESIKTEYTLFYGRTVATESEAVVSGISNLHVVPIEDRERFVFLLRNCLIFTLQSLQFLSTDKVPLNDYVVYQMYEAYRAFRKGGVAIITKGHDLQVQHVGLLSDLKLVEKQIAQDNGCKALEVSFKKKFNGIRGRSTCLDACIPYFPGIGDWYCPSCGRFMKCDLNLTCCHDNSD